MKNLLTALFLLLTGLSINSLAQTPITTAPWLVKEPLLPYKWQQRHPIKPPFTVLRISTVSLRSGGFLAATLNIVYKNSAHYLRLIRTNSSGDTLWTKHLNTPLTLQEPSFDPARPNEQGICALEDPAGSVLITTGNGVVKITTQGDTIWTRKFAPPIGMTFKSRKTILSKPLIDAEGNYLVAYHFYDYSSTGTASDIHLVKLARETGAVIRNTDLQVVLPPTMLPNDYSALDPYPWRLLNIEHRTGGSFVFFTGILPSQTRRQIGIILLDGQGNSTFRTLSRQYTHVWETFSLTLPTKEGSTFLLDENVIYNLSAAGDTLWSKRITPFTGGYFPILSALLDTQDNIIFTRGIGDFLFRNVEQSYVLLERYTSKGERYNAHLVSEIVPGGNNKLYYQIFATPTGSLAIAGTNTAGNGGINKPSFILGEFGNLTPLSTKSSRKFDQLVAYPNPSNGSSITITLPTEALKGHLCLRDQLGRVVWQQGTKSAPTVQVLTKDLKTGMYLLEYTTDKGVWTNKLVCQ